MVCHLNISCVCSRVEVNYCVEGTLDFGLGSPESALLISMIKSQGIKVYQCVNRVTVLESKVQLCVFT